MPREYRRPLRRPAQSAISLLLIGDAAGVQGKGREGYAPNGFQFEHIATCAPVLASCHRTFMYKTGQLVLELLSGCDFTKHVSEDANEA